MNEIPFEQSSNDELLIEYHFDYKKVKLNRFANCDRAQLLKVVVLDEDVAKIFTSADAVNKILRALIESMPQATT